MWYSYNYLAWLSLWIVNTISFNREIVCIHIFNSQYDSHLGCFPSHFSLCLSLLSIWLRSVMVMIPVGRPEQCQQRKHRPTGKSEARLLENKWCACWHKFLTIDMGWNFPKITDFLDILGENVKYVFKGVTKIHV